MLRLLKNWFAPKANPIGVDFGSDCLRLAQVHHVGNEYRLLAAASSEVPSDIKGNPVERMNFFVKTTKDLLAQGKFEGRDAILALPACSMFIEHLRVAKMDDDQLKRSLPNEAKGKLPIDPNSAILRHIVAGEVYQDLEPKDEIILMAAASKQVDLFLAAAAKARLNVVGMNVEPAALIDCFAHVYRRKTDSDSTNFFVDIGASGTRAVIARGGHVLFARAIPIGGDHLNHALAASMNVSFDCARQIHIKLCHTQPHDEAARNYAPAGQTPRTNAAIQVSDNGDSRRSGVTDTATAVIDAPPLAITEEIENRGEDACAPVIGKLVEELNLCREYYEKTFVHRPVDRLIFVGGESRNRGLCQRLAQSMGIGAQVGDPLVRMGRISDVGMESGIDRRHPQPAWAVAIGLSMGPGDKST